jgi:hypothetical protein
MARWIKNIAVLGALSAGLFSATRAFADAVSADWLAATTNEGGQHCDRKAERAEASRLLLACGAAGVWDIALDATGPHFLRSRQFPGEAVGFFAESDGRVWVKLQVLEARPLDAASVPAAALFPLPETDAGEPAPPASPPAVAQPRPKSPAQPSAVPIAKVGRVLRAEPGEATISLGTADLIARSDRIELSLGRSSGEAGEAGEAGLSREIVAVGVVTHVTDHTARVLLGINESVPVGAYATPTAARVTASLAAPPRVSDGWSVEAMSRSFAAMDELGGGTLLSAGVSYRFPHLHLQALLDPLGIADVKGSPAIGARSGALIASYDSQYFEMGLGLGAQTVNGTGFTFTPGSGFTLVQAIRLGALDGLNISARTNVVLFHSRFRFGAMTASGQIPVTRGYWLLLGGGGGDVGYGYGELGLRVLLQGNGNAGSKFLTVSVGGAGIFEDAECNSSFDFCGGSRTYAGPMAGLGGEWRF